MAIFSQYTWVSQTKIREAPVSFMYIYCGCCDLIRYLFMFTCDNCYLGPSKCIVLMSGDVIREAFIVKAHDFDGRLHFPSGT